ncbi:hypothetical protein ACFWGG_21395, partial [Streptomyces roseolus]
MAAHDDDINRGIRPGRGSEDPAGQVAYLEQEIAVLRRKLADSPRHTRILEERIVELQTNRRPASPGDRGGGAPS